MNTLFNEKDFQDFEDKKHFPFIIHPYKEWLNFENKKPAQIVASIISDFESNSIFQKKLKAAKKDIIGTPFRFYQVMTEWKIANYLSNTFSSFEFLDGELKSPDFKADGVYIEATSLFKSIPIILHLQKEIQANLKNKEYIFLFHPRYFRRKVPLAHFKDDDLRKIAEEVTGNILSGELEGQISIPYKDEIYFLPWLCSKEKTHPYNRIGNSNPKTLDIYVQEILNGKKNRNDLRGHRPNIVWGEIIFLEDANIAVSDSELNNYYPNVVIPDEIDAFIISLCGIDRQYDDPNWIRMSINPNSVYQKELKVFLQKLYPKVTI